ncbi:hypothetical protein EJ07DRAFT_121269 [Lizonia empirigonia]|nr:hypothetical protein EJ07DRAFT_121269 [Lizonia empirigonia]
MATTSSRLDLTVLDQTILRVYVRQLLIFPFPDPNYRIQAQKVLYTGLFEVLRQYPFLAGTVEQTNSFTGALAVKYPEVIDSVLVSRLIGVTTYEPGGFDYDILSEEGVPPSRLRSDTFCPFALIEHRGLDDPFAEGLTTFNKGHPIPVFAAQITFIPGGLVLSAYTHHSVVDGTGIAKIYQAWSESTQTQGSQGLSKIRTQAGSDTLNNARHALDTLIVNASPMNLPEFRYPEDPIPTPPLRDSPYKLTTKIFVFSAKKISQLARSLSSITKARISTFTALTALIWSHITHARRAALIERDIHKTTVGIAIDHRKRVGSLLPDDYIGNCANGMAISLPLSSIPATKTMNEEQIAPVALAISDCLGEINLDWFRARLLHMSKQPNPSKLLLNMDTRNGPDIFLTSWMHIGADNVWAIPGTAKTGDGNWRCKPTAIRKPQCASEGGLQILPRQKGDEAPFEILACLEEGEMMKTIEGLQYGGWVLRLVDG